jgi:hypothetical protein
MQHFDSELLEGAIPSYLRRDQEMLSEPDLHLDISSFMDDEGTDPLMFDLNDEHVEVHEIDDCCHRENSEKDYDANESTFISYLPEPEQSLDMIPFDQTFENMDATMNESVINSTKVLPHSFPRSRFISE